MLIFFLGLVAVTNGFIAADETKKNCAASLAMFAMLQLQYGVTVVSVKAREGHTSSITANPSLVPSKALP